MQQLDLDSRERYLIDTSSLVDVETENNPDQVWEGLFRLVGEGRLLTVGYVFEEMERMVANGKLRQEILKRLKEFKHVMVVPDDEILLETGNINFKYPRLGDWRDPKNSADPWLVAAGKVRGYSVITEESDVGPKKKRKIPWVCDQEGVRWLRLSKLISNESLR